MSALTSVTPTASSVRLPRSPLFWQIGLGSKSSWRLWGLAAFLVSVPVFIQAPLVRTWPWLSLLLTLAWIGLGIQLYRQDTTRRIGDLLLGFSSSWLAGSLYWGWFRWEPLIHLPIESIGLPLAVWAIWRARRSANTAYLMGALFYLGSLWGTAITDLYFYVVGLIPYWREIMQVSPDDSVPILREALRHIQTPWGILWVGILASVLCVSGLIPFVRLSVFRGRSHSLHWWAFSGAVVSSLLVDGLFWLAARFA